MKSLKERISDELYWSEKGPLTGFNDQFNQQQIDILNTVLEAIIRGVEQWVTNDYSVALEEWLKNEFVPALFTREGRVVLVPDHDEKENNETIEKDKDDVH